MTPHARRNRPGYEQTPRLEAEPDALAHIPNGDLETLALRLMDLDFGPRGMTRDQLRRRLKDLPEALYLRLPASRHYFAAADVLRDVGSAPSRAEGDFAGANPDIPEAESVEEGGPPAWGPDPLLTRGGVEDSGSAEDRDERDAGDEER
ncbi:MAG TPA: hypothetical protein VF808_13465 [Ktedonobacterales bacterium]